MIQIGRFYTQPTISFFLHDVTAVWWQSVGFTKEPYWCEYIRRKHRRVYVYDTIL